MPTGMGSNDFHQWGKGSKKLAGHIPDRVSLSIKEGSIMCSGCGCLIADKILRLSHNSPF